MTPTQLRRTENLALIFQEVLTAIERLRGNRQNVNDPQTFRHHCREALKAAATRAIQLGYTNEDVKYVAFATIAFLDESVLNARNPVFGEWQRSPLQQELFGTNKAGEVVFDNLQALLGRSDSPELADLLEVHHLCLLLGFRGRYAQSSRGEISQIITMLSDRIGRIRGPRGGLAPAWSLPKHDAVRKVRDPWVKRLGIIAIIAAVIMILLFAGYHYSLGGGVTEIQALGKQGRS